MEWLLWYRSRPTQQGEPDLSRDATWITRAASGPERPERLGLLRDPGHYLASSSAPFKPSSAGHGCSRFALARRKPSGLTGFAHRQV